MLAKKVHVLLTLVIRLLSTALPLQQAGGIEHHADIRDGLRGGGDDGADQPKGSQPHADGRSQLRVWVKCYNACGFFWLSIGLHRKGHTMQHFSSIQKIDRGILYALELASSVSILLLPFRLIASMANVLTEGAVLTDNLLMQRIWAVTQCVGIDTSVAGTIIRTFQYHQEGEKVKTWLYALLSVLLLFTAAIALNIDKLPLGYHTPKKPLERIVGMRSVGSVSPVDQDGTTPLRLTGASSSGRERL